MRQVNYTPNFSKRETQKIELPAFTLVEDKSYVLTTEKDIVSFIDEVEGLVRSSDEYRELISFLKDKMNLDNCGFFKRLGNVRIELHHEPFTLFDIIHVVLKKYMVEGYEINPLKIADEVMRLHYENKVGLFPLSLTCHEMVHAHKLFIPMQYVYGQFYKFYEEYAPYIEEIDDLQMKLSAKISLSKQIDTLDQEALKVKFTYVEVDGFTLPELPN